MLCYYGDDKEEYTRWEDNIKMDLRNSCQCDELTQDRDHWTALVNVALSLQVT